MTTKAIYGECLLAAAGIDWKPYIARVGQRPSAQRVTADRKRDTERAAAARAQNKA
jgi:glutathione S-transferase